jgi:hypothetical protein
MLLDGANSNRKGSNARSLSEEAILLRQTIYRHLGRSWPEKILNYSSEYGPRVFRTCAISSASISLSPATKDHSDKLPAGTRLPCDATLEGSRDVFDCSGGPGKNNGVP